ncbi:transketolase [Nanoarchaeota archaeon]
MNLTDVALEIRRRTLKSLYSAQSGHPGPSLSIVEMLSTLFFKEMNIKGEERDRFILSKGHAAASFYAVLSILGHISEDQLLTLREMGSPLQGHPVKGTLPLVDASTGSLGQGLSIGIGYALGIKLKGQDRRVYVIIGDGESQEGQIWEAAMAAPKFKLGNLLVIVDYNKYQNDGAVKDIMPLDPLADKWKSFGWHVQEVDGHDMDALTEAYQNARKERDKPSVIVANTMKGKGISFMEGEMSWHSKAMKPEEYESAMNELGVKPDE